MNLSLKHDYIRIEFLPLDHGTTTFTYGFKVDSTQESLQKKIKLNTKILSRGRGHIRFVELDCGENWKKFGLSEGDYRDIMSFMVRYPNSVAHLIPKPIIPRRIVNAIMELGICI